MSQAVKEIIILTANYYSKTLNPHVLEMYVEDLQGFGDSAVIEAYKKYRKDPKNKVFPLPAQIMEILNPTISKDAQAHEITSRIVQAITKFGNLESKYPELRAFVGEIGMGVVRRLGGWPYIVAEHGRALSPGQFYAQTRDQIKSKLEIEEHGNVDISLLLNGPEKETKQLPEPIKFSEEETKQISETMKGQPRELVEKFIEGLAKKKEMERDQDSFLKHINPKTIEKGAS